MIKSASFLILSFLFISIQANSFQKIDEWLLEREKKGIKIFTKKGRWGKLKDSKAVMFLHTSKEQVLKILLDYNAYPSWVPRCKDSKIIARIGEDEFIAHLTFNAPWPVANRDCVERVKIERNEATRTTIMHITSDPKYLSPVEGVVRIEKMIAYWKIVEKADGVEVTNEYASDPGGSLPDWVVNAQSVEGPYETFTSIQNKIPTPIKYPKVSPR
jgi:hypothetical protein